MESDIQSNLLADPDTQNIASTSSSLTSSKSTPKISISSRPRSLKRKLTLESDESINTDTESDSDTDPEVNSRVDPIIDRKTFISQVNIMKITIPLKRSLHLTLNDGPCKRKPKFSKTIVADFNNNENVDSNISSLNKDLSLANVDDQFPELIAKSKPTRTNSTLISFDTSSSCKPWALKTRNLKNHFQQSVENQNNRSRMKQKQERRTDITVKTYTNSYTEVDVDEMKCQEKMSTSVVAVKIARSTFPDKNPFVSLAPMIIIQNSNHLLDSTQLETKPSSEIPSPGLLDVIVPSPSGQCNSSTSEPSKENKFETNWESRMTRRGRTSESLIEKSICGDIVVKFKTKTDSKPSKPVVPRTVFVCDCCLTYFKRQLNYKKHPTICKLVGRKPPGRIVYKKESTVIYEVDGSLEQFYCFNLSKLSKVFVNSLSGWSHTKLFMYYVLYVSDRFAGYFSKEKLLTKVLNLGVLLVLPSHQKQGLGKLLISFSYEISKLEKQLGTPERPLSDSGLQCYLSYWIECTLRYIAIHNLKELTIDNLSEGTYIHKDDLVLAFKKVCVIHKLKDSFILEIPTDVWNRFLMSNEASSILATSSPTTTTATSSKMMKSKLDVNCILWR